MALEAVRTLTGIPRILRKETLASIPLGLLTAVLVWVFVYYVTHKNLGEAEIILASIVSVPLGLLAIYSVSRFGSWHKFLNHLRLISVRRYGAHEPIPFEISLYSTHVRVEYQSHANDLRWSYFDRVCMLESYITLNTAGTYSGFAIPRSAFATSEDADRFFSTARALLHASGSSTYSRFKARFDAGEISCPVCKYSLKGTEDARCPECGTQTGSIHVRCGDVASLPLRRFMFYTAPNGASAQAQRDEIAAPPTGSN